MSRTAGICVSTRHAVLKNFVDQRIVNGGADIGDGDRSLRVGRGQSDGDFALSGAVTLGVLQDVGNNVFQRIFVGAGVYCLVPCDEADVVNVDGGSVVGDV